MIIRLEKMVGNQRRKQKSIKQYNIFLAQVFDLLHFKPSRYTIVIGGAYWENLAFTRGDDKDYLLRVIYCGPIEQLLPRALLLPRACSFNSALCPASPTSA